MFFSARTKHCKLWWWFIFLSRGGTLLGIKTSLVKELWSTTTGSHPRGRSRGLGPPSCPKWRWRRGYPKHGWHGGERGDMLHLILIRSYSRPSSVLSQAPRQR